MLNLKEPPLSRPIKDKILWAQQVFATYGNDLLLDPAIRGNLTTLKSLIKDSSQAMVDLGIVSICQRCETQEGGSCCGSGMENRYNGVLLLVNILLGVTLPKERRFNDSCFFLGSGGCLLIARHTICINFLCKKITDTIEESRLSDLRKKEGAEIESLFLLCEKLKRILKPLGIR